MLKKAVAAIAVCLLLCGCGKAASFADYEIFNSPFELTADYSSSTTTGSVSFVRNSPEQCAIEIISPESLCGMRLTCTEGIVACEFEGLVSETEYSSLKKGSLLSALNDCFAQFAMEKPSGTESSDGEIEYTLENGTKMTVFGQKVKSIELPQYELTFKITAFEFAS